MSLSASLSNALSGLQYASRAAEVTSSNVANALNEGYARRVLEVSARSIGSESQGVRLLGVTRIVDQVLLADRRLAEAATGDRDARATYFGRLEAVIDTAVSGSLLDRIADFDTALISAASRPDSEARLAEVLSSAKALASGINFVATKLQQARMTADAAIAREVDALNVAVRGVWELNRLITERAVSGEDVSALEDQRQQLVDQVSSIVPLREVQRSYGQIALFTTSGGVLLDGLPSELGFTPHPVIVPEMTLAGGLLSGLTLKGRSVATAGEASVIAGGSLAAHFAIRDELAPEGQVQIDALARDLVERFADPALDPSRAPGDAGLFTDNGAAFLAADELGLASRLSVTALVDPDQGGLLRRLRDGLSAPAGPVGDASLLLALDDALTAGRVPVSGFLSGARSFAGLASDLLSDVSIARLAADSEASFAAARWDALHQQELELGVDSDAEMQQMLLIEQAYAANAKIVQTLDDLLALLLEI
ncbi:flagellar hook-associated protein FlgK [Cereibacter changlensis]|uniref:flagellar hook-associated protein FlgK n=1 Tax=Cereibacter changlensis TaxID=402884 RepID=UPI004034C6BA